VPFKADAVVQIEDTISLEKNVKGNDTKIKIVSSGVCGGGGSGTNTSNQVKIDIGQDIRSIGFDIKQGEIVMNARTLINASQIGVMATVGTTSLNVFKLPRVGLISTGNELASPTETILKSGQIRDSNKSLLMAALKSFGLNDIYDAGICNDDPDNVLATFRLAMEKSDVIISTGGVSMGDKDLVKDVLSKDLKCDIHFARMNMKPGKPTTFASLIYEGRRKLFFCLPGIFFSIHFFLSLNLN
jgi:gephyrin